MVSVNVVVEFFSIVKIKVYLRFVVDVFCYGFIFMVLNIYCFIGKNWVFDFCI